MDTPQTTSEQLDRVAALAEPVRRRLYEFVARSGAPVDRDAAAAGVGIGRPLAAFHLDRLVTAGLLDVEFRRRNLRDRDRARRQGEVGGARGRTGARPGDGLERRGGAWAPADAGDAGLRAVPRRRWRRPASKLPVPFAGGRA